MKTEKKKLVITGMMVAKAVFYASLFLTVAMLVADIFKWQELKIGNLVILLCSSSLLRISIIGKK